MNNNIFYIKPTNFDFPEAIKDGLIKAFSVVKQKGLSNIKLVLTGMNLLDSPPNHISDAIDKIFNGQGVSLTNQLKRNRGISIQDFPTVGQTTGINVLLANNNLSFLDNNTVVVLLFADYDSFKKVQSLLFWTTIDLVAVIYNETSELNEILSASKASNISSNLDPNVTAYTNTFVQNVNVILDRLKSINITDVATHVPTRERMKSVIDELNQNKLTVSYEDFLGFLVNDVNFKFDESVELLNWKRRYFGR